MVSIPEAERVIERDPYVHIDACREHRRATTCAVHYELALESEGREVASGRVEWRVAVERIHGRLVMRDLL